MPRPFFDTNVLVYLVSKDAKKAKVAEDLVKLGGTVSVQVLNEAIAVLRGKLRCEWAEVDLFLVGIRANLPVALLTEETHDLARAYAERFQLRIYDACILAAAKLAGCDTLWSEDLQDGFVVDGVTIRDPFSP